MADYSKYSKNYSESGLWSTITKYAKKMGRGTVEDALVLYYAMKLGKASGIQIASIIGVLGYLICPVDAIPDFLPGGLFDDAGVLSAAVSGLGCCDDYQVQRAVEAKLRQWFG